MCIIICTDIIILSGLNLRGNGGGKMAYLRKLVKLAALLASGNGVTVNELLNNSEFGYHSRSSIYQDFRNLENSFGLFPERSDELRGKSGREAVYRIDGEQWKNFRSEFITCSFDAKDRRRLAFLLESIGNTSPLFDVSADDVIVKLQGLLGDINVRPSRYGGYFSLDTAMILDKLLEAQDTKKLINITYDGTEREVFVIRCFVFSGGTYCYVMKKTGWVYMMSIPRIERVGPGQLLNTRNIPYPEPSIDVEKALADPFGIVRGETEFDAVVRLSDTQAFYEKEKLWPDSVSIERKGDHWLFKVHTCGVYWLKRWVMSLGTEAELLEPSWLRDEIRSDIETMSVLYNGHEKGENSWTVSN